MQGRRNGLFVRLQRTLRRRSAGGRSNSTSAIDEERDENRNESRLAFPSPRYVLRRLRKGSRRLRSTTTSSSSEEEPNPATPSASAEGLTSLDGGSSSTRNRPTLPPPQQSVSEPREPEPLAIIETDDGNSSRSSTPNFQEIQMLDHFSPSDVGLYSWGDSFEDLSELPVEDEDFAYKEHWCISGEEISLEKLTSSSPGELVYNGYWHGRVSAHARYFVNSKQRDRIQEDINTLDKTRHDIIQLFMGVSVDLHSDYIIILMEEMKGETLESMVQWRDFRSNFDDFMKITEQISHGLNYLHSKGISHPLLTSQSITVKRNRPCISILTPGYASMGLLKTSDLPYVPPEALCTVKKYTINESSSNSPPSSPHSVHGLKKCFTPPIGLVFGLPNSSSSSSSSRLTPGSPNIRSSRRILDTGVSHRRGSIEDTIDCSTPVKRVVLKGSREKMQSPEANVYAFGTLLFELIMNRKPACSTKGNDLHEVLLPQGRIKQMVKSCWSTRPEERPSFTDLLCSLDNMSPKTWLARDHFSFSVSIPENLDLL